MEDFALKNEALRLEARELAQQLRDGLPEVLDPTTLGVRDKAPTKIMAAREALRWRTEEVARNACDALDKNDLAVAAVLTRAVTESAAMVWKLMHTLETRRNRTPDEFDKVLMRLLLGSKSEAEGPRAFNVLDFLDLMDKEATGIREAYDKLSEFAHPNWSGTAGLFSETSGRFLLTRFGRDLRQSERHKFDIAEVLVYSLELFSRAYNDISRAMPGYLKELQPLSRQGLKMPTEK